MARTSAPSRVTRRDQAARANLTRNVDLRWCLGAVVLGAAVWALYGPSLSAPLIFDDGAAIVHNRSIRHLWPLLDSATGYGPLLAPPETPVHGRPAVNLTFAVNYCYGQLDPRGYRAFNIALHAISAVLLWSVLRRTLEFPALGDRFAGVATPLSFVAALLWAVHPLCTEAVVYVTQRTELMMGLCYVATFYAAQRYWSAETTAGRRLWGLVAALACLVGMLSKETMITAPLMILLYERQFVAGTLRQAWRRSWPLYVGLLAAAVPLVALNLHGPRTPLAGFGFGVSAISWWSTQAQVVFRYIKLLVWPWPLVIDYEIPLLSPSQAWPWLLLAGLLFVATCYLSWKRLPSGYVGLFFFTVLSPTLVFPIPTEVAAERRLYVPLMAFVAWAVGGGYFVLERVAARTARQSQRGMRARRITRAPLALALLIGLIYASLSAQRLFAYHDELILWLDTVDKMPTSGTARINLGQELAKRGELAQAIDQYEQAVALEPDFFLAHSGLASVLERAGRFEEAQREFAAALRLRPDMAAGHYNMARMWEHAGDLDRAQQEYEEALRLYPEFPMAHFALGALLDTAGQTASAQEHYEQALRLHEDYPSAHRNLGILLGRAGQSDRAIEHLREVVRLAPTFDAYRNLAVAYSQGNQPAAAIEMGQRAAALARQQGQTAEAERLERWLQGYRRSAARNANVDPAGNSGAP